jgi:hypothetical protein
VSDRAIWLEQWCPECGAVPGARCSRRSRGRRVGGGRLVPDAHFHISRGWVERPCPTCKAESGERCSTPSGRPSPRVHTARLRPPRRELVWRPAVWEELERRDATVAVVPFWGRAGRGGQTERIDLLRVECERLVEVERWTSRDELCYALEAPVWERFGTFVGLPLTQGEVIWTVADRLVLIRGRRGGRTFEEFVR